MADPGAADNQSVRTARSTRSARSSKSKGSDLPDISRTMEHVQHLFSEVRSLPADGVLLPIAVCRKQERLAAMGASSSIGGLSEDPDALDEADEEALSPVSHGAGRANAESPGKPLSPFEKRLAYDNALREKAKKQMHARSPNAETTPSAPANAPHLDFNARIRAELMNTAMKGLAYDADKGAPREDETAEYEDLLIRLHAEHSAPEAPEALKIRSRRRPTVSSGDVRAMDLVRQGLTGSVHISPKEFNAMNQGRVGRAMFDSLVTKQQRQVEKQMKQQMMQLES